MSNQSENNNSQQVARSWWHSIVEWVTYPFSHNKGKSWAESFQHLVVAFSIIVSGVWVYSTFVLLNEKEKAEVQIDKTKSELEKMTLELEQLKALIDANISSNITISANTVENTGKLGFIVEAKIRNTGSRPVTMTWERSPFIIYKVAYENEIQANSKEYHPHIYQNLTRGEVKYVSELYLLVGAEKNLSTYIELESCGLYLVMFKAKPDNQLIEQSKKTNEKEGLWFASKYFSVKNLSMCKQ